MTILVVDAGNTRIKWAILTRRAGMHKCRQRQDAGSDQGVLDNVLDNTGQTERPPHSTKRFQTFAAHYWTPLVRPARVVVANVAGADFGATLAAWVKQTWDIEAEFVVPQHSACGIHVGPA